MRNRSWTAEIEFAEWIEWDGDAVKVIASALVEFDPGAGFDCPRSLTAELRKAVVVGGARDILNELAPDQVGVLQAHAEEEAALVLEEGGRDPDDAYDSRFDKPWRDA